MSAPAPNKRPSGGPKKPHSMPQMIALGGTATGSGPPASAIKREAPVPVSAPSMPKKAKLSPSTSSSTTIRRPSVDVFESAVELDSHEIMSRVQSAEDKGDEAKIDSYLIGAVKSLRSSRLKIETSLYLSLLYLVKTKPQYFSREPVADALATLLKRDTASINEAIRNRIKGNPAVPIVAANVLMAAFKDEPNWPKSLVKVYIEDSLNERIWVDRGECKTFIENIITAFGTKVPPKSMMSQDVLLTTNPSLKNESPASASPTHPARDADDSRDDDSASFVFASDLKDRLEEDVIVTPRFLHCQEEVHKFTTDTINEHFARRQVASDIGRNMIRLLICTVGIAEIRLTVASKLEMWLQNPKVTRPAQDLLLSVCLNCNPEKDREVMNYLVKMRLKTKPLVNHLMLCVRELLNQKEENLSVLLQQCIFNELGIAGPRGPNNFQIIAVIFQHSPEKATKALATVYQELLLVKDCFHLRALRMTLKEIIRTLRHDHINFTLFVATLVEEHPDFLRIDPADSFLRDRIFYSITDLITFCMFVSISTSIKEAASTLKYDRKDVLRLFQVQIAEMQRLGVYWIQKVVMKLFRPSTVEDFKNCLHKILLIEMPEPYNADSKEKDNSWPIDNERQFLYRISSEVPVLEETLIRLLNMGLSKTHPINGPKAIELCETLIMRAASIYDGNDSSPYRVLKIQNPDIFNLIFKCAAYRVPENIVLPSGYEPPLLAISDWLWKCWIQLLIIASHNPGYIAMKAWNEFPTLSLLMEMAITNCFEFPPPTRLGDDLKNKLKQFAAIEKQQILQFESQLAAVSTKAQITEQNSLLLSSLINYDGPEAPAREPPPPILDQLKKLNLQLKIGHLLCQSRSPDLLLEILQRQQQKSLTNSGVAGASSSNLTASSHQIGGGTSNGAPLAMPWLNELVEMHEENFSLLPVQCLCLFLLGQIYDEEQAAQVQEAPLSSSHRTSDKMKRREKKRKQMKLIAHLQHTLRSSETNSRSLIEYFTERLSNRQSSIRQLASKALNLILRTVPVTDDFTLCVENNVNAWLLDALPRSKFFERVKDIVCEGLRVAILIDNYPPDICCYVQFLNSYADPADGGVILSLSNLLIDRGSIMRFLIAEPLRDKFIAAITCIFHGHLDWVKKRDDRTFWSDSSDRVIVRWSNGQSAVLDDIMIVHAMVVLLTYGPVESTKKHFDDLMDTWFSDLPSVYMLDTQEETLLTPDWLKMKLIRSTNDRLVKSTVVDLPAEQLLMFVQSFGVPEASMERLLAALDKCAESDRAGLLSSLYQIGDPKFMKILMEVQWMRGVKTGHKFVELLDA